MRTKTFPPFPGTAFASLMGTYLTLKHLTVAADGVLTHSDNSTAESFRIDLTIPGDFIVHAGGRSTSMFAATARGGW